MARILVIDDDYEVAAMLSEVLRQEGHEVRCAADAGQGLEAARLFRPELVILDYQMPDVSGAHLFESLRRNEASRGTPILFISGEARPERILAEVSDPAGSRFLAKPLSLEDLRRDIRELLAERGNA
ncbi:MAG: response regulator [Elusimicrobia bacterium]|nr:response regulator [Elusimicrobiota bacterium]